MEAAVMSVNRHVRTFTIILGAAGVAVALGLLWQYTPLAEFADPRQLLRLLRSLAANELLAPFIIGAVIAVGNLLFIPINALLLAAALAFPGWAGFFYGMVGALMAACLQAWVGRFIGAERAEKRFGEKFQIISDETRRNGIWAVVVLCWVPIAPNIVTNLVAGICRLPYWKLAVGTVIGFLPGLIILNLLGVNMRSLIDDPSVGAAIAGVGLVGLLVLSAVIGKRYKARIESRRRRGSDSRSN